MSTELLAKKYGEETDSLLNHLLKNKWGAETLIEDSRILEKINDIDPNIKDGIVLASVFHDLGKSNESFQDKLINGSKKELLTHDAISFLFLFEHYQKTKEISFLFAAYASLKHHNRAIFIENLPNSTKGIKNLINNCFDDIKKYVEEQRLRNLNIDDSQWIRRSHSNGSDEISRINLRKNVLDVYNKLQYQSITPDLEIFINKINNLSKKEVIELFIKYLRGLIKYSEESKDVTGFYCKLLLTKSLFKICDEIASQKDMVLIEHVYKQEFKNYISNLFFFKKDLSTDAEKILSNELTPRPFQKEILDASELKSCILIDANTGGGKTLAAELIKYKLNKNFISYHTPTRFLALEQASRIFDNLDDLLEAKKIRYIKEMSIYHHTIDQIYLALVGYKREYLFLKLFLNGVVVFDEIDLFQDRKSFFNIAFMLRVLSKLRIPTVITTATSTETLEKFIFNNYGEIEIFPKKRIESNDVRAKIERFRYNSSSNLYEILTPKLIQYQNEGKKIGIFLNNTSSCVLLSSYLKSLKIDNILYHAKLSTETKQENKNKLLNMFNKQSKKLDKYPIAIMSPLAEVGIDISFEIMFTDPAPVRNIEQRAGRLNRWNTQPNSKLFIFDNFMCGFGSKKNPNLQKPCYINDLEIVSFDPYFGDSIIAYNQQNSVYDDLNNINMGFETTYLNSIIKNKFLEFKDKWFKGILNNEKIGVLSSYDKGIPEYSKDYDYSLSILPFIFIKETHPDFLNMCFRQVNAIEYENTITKQEYSSVPIYMIEKGNIKKEYKESTEFGIAKAWAYILNKK